MITSQPEVAATTSAIAGLRRQLRRLGTIEHPAIRRELRKLEEQLTTLFEQAGRKPGRHRFPPSKAPGPGQRPSELRDRPRRARAGPQAHDERIGRARATLPQILLLPMELATFSGIQAGLARVVKGFEPTSTPWKFSDIDLSFIQTFARDWLTDA